MYRTFCVAALTLALATGAIAQSKDQNASAKGEWQASKLIHLNVYNEQNDKIGDIKELMLDKSGKIGDVVIGVGGFLGMGEHDVAVKFEQLKWVNEPAKTNNSAKNTDTKAGSTTGTNTERRSTQNYPDHALLNVTKDQLKSMPAFNYDK